MKKMIIIVAVVAIIIATLLCLNSCMNIYASNATKNQIDNSDTSEVEETLAHENASATLGEIVTTKKIYDSSTIKVEKRESVSIEEIQALVDECVEIYNNYDEIKLSRFENKQAITAGYLVSYKDYLSYTIRHKHAEGLSAATDSELAELESDLRKIENYEDLDTVILHRSDMSYMALMELARDGFIIIPDKRIIDEKYYELSFKAYIFSYEEVIASMVVDRLMAILPEEYFTFTNFDNYQLRNIDRYWVDISLDSSGEKQLMVQFSDHNSFVLWQVKDGESSEVILPFGETTKLARQLGLRAKPNPSYYDRIPDLYYQEAITDYETWKQQVEQYKQNKNLVK